MNGSGPDFDFDLVYGEAGERYAREVLGWVLAENARVEIKRKRRLDDWLYVELRQNAHRSGWKDSGLNVTTAQFWGFVVGETGVILYFPTDLLRRAVARGEGRDAEETDGDNPTQGRLLRASRLIQIAGGG